MNKNLCRALFVSFMMFTTIPSVQAGEMADTFSKSFGVDTMYYRATADMKVEKSKEMDIPFTAEIKVEEEGGKSGNNYSEQGGMSASIRNISDLPAELSDLSYVNMLLKYKGQYVDQNKVAYGLVDDFNVTTDSKEFKKIADMMNQMAKFITGKYFRISLTELSKSLESSLSGIASAEDLALLNTLSGNSLREITMASGQLLDSMISSGILQDSIQDLDGRRTNSTKRHVLTLGQSISSSGAEAFRAALIRFFDDVFPALSADIKQEMQWQTSADIAQELNAFLGEMKGVNVSIQVDVLNGLLQNITFDMNLRSVGVPLTLSESVVFDYSRSFQISIPQNQSNLIDLNKIVEGFTALAQLGTSGFNTPSYYEDPYADYDTNYYLALDTIDEISDQLWNYCGDDAACRKRQIQSLKRDLRQLKNEGSISASEFREKIRQLNSLR